MSNNKGKKANEPMSYAEAAAKGVPYHAPSTYQTPAPIYTHGHNTGPGYGQATRMYPAHQAAMNKLFIRPDGTIRPGPYPHGYYPHAVASSRGYNQAVLGAAALAGTAAATGIGAAGLHAVNAARGIGEVGAGAVDAAIKLGEIGCAGCNAGCACVVGGRRSRKRKSKRKTMRKKTRKLR